MSRKERGAFFVVNPKSAGGRTGREWPQIEGRLRRDLEEVGSAMTAARGEATTLARQALREGWGLVVAVGGDGTNNEVVNGFFEDDQPVNPDAAFGLLQRGTGGDFKRTLGLMGTLDEYLDFLRGEFTKPIDLGRLSFVDHEGRPATRHFLNIASFGIGGVFDDYLNKSPKLLPGRFATTWAGLRAAVSYRNQKVRYRLDDGPEREQRVNSFAIANGRYYGGAMFVAPQAELDDGLFDVVVMGDFHFADMLDFTRRIYRGTHLEMAKVWSQRARKVEADSNETVLLDVDGEQPGRLPATFEVLPGALKLKVAGA